MAEGGAPERNPDAIADAKLIAGLETALARMARAAGGWLACHPGCAECCIGPFPITQLDAQRLQRGLAELGRTEPARAAAIHARAKRAVTLMAPAFPGEARTGILAEDDEAEERFCERFASLPCPVLDPQTGLCQLYASRPVSCRTYGLPLRIGGQNLPSCRLCFLGAPPEEVERCRVEPDPTDEEGKALAALKALGGLKGETLVAFAVTLAPRRP